MGKKTNLFRHLRQTVFCLCSCAKFQQIWISMRIATDTSCASFAKFKGNFNWCYRKSNVTNFIKERKCGKLNWKSSFVFNFLLSKTSIFEKLTKLFDFISRSDSDRKAFLLINFVETKQSQELSISAKRCPKQFTLCSNWVLIKK